MQYRGIRGRVALLKWSYFVAGAIEGYAVSRDKKSGWTVTGTLVPGKVDSFKLAQRPLFFVAPFKGGAWRWQVESLEYGSGGRFSARLGFMTTEGANGIVTHTSTRN